MKPTDHLFPRDFGRWPRHCRAIVFQCLLKVMRSARGRDGLACGRREWGSARGERGGGGWQTVGRRSWVFERTPRMSAQLRRLHDEMEQK